MGGKRSGSLARVGLLRSWVEREGTDDDGQARLCSTFRSVA